MPIESSKNASLFFVFFFALNERLIFHGPFGISISHGKFYTGKSHNQSAFEAKQQDIMTFIALENTNEGKNKIFIFIRKVFVGLWLFLIDGRVNYKRSQVLSHNTHCLRNITFPSRRMNCLVLFGSA